jgi:hypothetical protein
MKKPPIVLKVQLVKPGIPSNKRLTFYAYTDEFKARLLERIAAGDIYHIQATQDDPWKVDGYSKSGEWHEAMTESIQLPSTEK